MKILEFKKDIDNCRFCWMCRHVCTQGRVTGVESHTARALGLLLAAIQRGAREYDESTSERMYQCCQCAYCTEWCVSDYRAAKYIRAAREDIYTDHYQLVPAPVKEALTKIKKNGHPWCVCEENTAKLEPSEGGENLLFIGSAARYLNPKTGEAAQSIMKKLGKPCTLLADEPDSGFWLWNLGAAYPFGLQARLTAKAIKAAGCARLVVVSPADYYLFTAEYGDLLEGIEIVALPLFAGVDMKKVIGDAAYCEASYYARWAGLIIAPGCEGKLFWNGSKSRDTGANLLPTYPEMAKNIADSLLNCAAEDGVAKLVCSGAENYAALTSADTKGIEVVELLSLIDAAL